MTKLIFVVLIFNNYNSFILKAILQPSDNVPTSRFFVFILHCVHCLEEIENCRSLELVREIMNCICIHWTSCDIHPGAMRFHFQFRIYRMELGGIINNLYHRSSDI